MAIFMNPRFISFYLFLTLLNFSLSAFKVAATDAELAWAFSYVLLGFSVLLTFSCWYLFRHRKSPKQLLPDALSVLLFVVAVTPLAADLTATKLDYTETDPSVAFTEMHLTYEGDDLTVTGKADFFPELSEGPGLVTLHGEEQARVTLSKEVTEPRIARVFQYHQVRYPLLGGYTTAKHGVLSHYVIYLPG